MQNKTVRELAKKHGVMLWEIGVALGKSEATMTRWMRVELDEKRKAAMLEAIEKIANERGKR